MTEVSRQIASRADAAAGPSFVEWAAVFAGAVLAAALSFVLLTFGTAIGLSATSPWPNSGLSAKVIASLAVFWAMVQQIGSVMAGAYVAGRMRTRWNDSGHEADFRDGLHGGLVWAVGVLISALLLFATAGLVTRTGAEVAGKTVASLASRTADPMDAVLDTMLRSNAARAAVPAAGGPAAARSEMANTGDTRAEVSRILASSVASGSLTPDNRSYLARLVAQRTGLSDQDAEKRVDEAVNAGRAAADKARRAALLTGFVTAAGLIVSLGAGWWAAMRGGDHRDRSVPLRFELGVRRPAPGA
ncbi:MAG: hypothetical protein EHM67_00755 [Hyphomicrobiaceae bacterium]|nr:MAG: hypothetical protein EHM67_00755 [Hyphomicrobiaceae bacterium]